MVDMHKRIYLFALIFAMGSVFAAPMKQPTVTPNVYKPGPRAGCDEENLAQSIVKACDAIYKDKHHPVKWESKSLSKQVCSGGAPFVGQRISYQVYGNVKQCPGAAALPASEAWVCDIEIAADYSVKPNHVYFSTCLG